MSTSNSSTTKPIRTASLVKRMLIGAAIALVLIALFVLPVEGKPEWGNFWKVRPLIIVPLAGAAGGACSYFLEYILGEGGRRKVLIVILSLLIYIIGLWLGTVLGLDGTLWD